jgi:hypothetical protein
MAVLNRCAISVVSLPPMVEWSRPFWTRDDMEGLGEDPSLYLIPTYESDEQARNVLGARYEAIFEAELHLWCVDRSRWPQPRSFELFQQWFAVRFFPLVEDLGSEPLHAYEVDESFQNTIRDAMT